MPLPVLEGLIRRRLLVNFRADPAVVSRVLPAPFTPKLWQGFSMVGICLIRLEEIRPQGLAWLPGLSSENAAHRVAVQWPGPEGLRDGVFIWRRDTDSWLNHLAGGRAFPGVHGLAEFQTADDGTRVSLALTTKSPALRVEVGGEAAAGLPGSSVFGSLQESSDFFAAGAVGYSASANGCRFDGMRLETRRWAVDALTVNRAFSSFFSDPARFPDGSIAFDHALVMRDIPHRWVAEPPIAGAR